MKLVVNDILKSGIKADIIGNPSREIDRLIIDSRSLSHTVGTMFCAIRTEASDGHRYAADLYRRGVRIFLLSEIPDELKEIASPDTLFIIVPDVENAIERLGAYCRQKLSGAKVIAIAGSYGKTVTKELIYRALLKKCKVYRSPRSWNSHLGVPLSLIEADPDSEVVLIECGIDREGEMKKLLAIVQPDISILTPVSDDYHPGFSSFECKISELIQIAKTSSLIIYDESNEVVGRMLNLAYPYASKVPVDAAEHKLKAFVSPTLNALNVVFNSDECCEEVSNRIMMHEGLNDCVMLYDAFTADLRSLSAALDFMRRRFTPVRTNTVILSDLVHPDLDDAALTDLYSSVAAELHAFGINRVIAVGKEICKYAHILSGSVKTEAVRSISDFLEHYDINRFSSETILIFMNPSADGEIVKNLLESPRHDTIFEIDLDAVVNNFNYYRSLLNSGTGLVAMVKASAYGTGALEISKTLQAQGASYLAVAVVDEGVDLRRGGITMPIVVLNPITSNYKALFDYDLEPSVFSMSELCTLTAEAVRQGKSRLNVHIKLDTGMHRVGFTETEIDTLADFLNIHKTVKVKSIFSHLATADCLDQDEYTLSQLTTFDSMSNRLMASIPYPVKRHILNTAGMMRFPEYQYDMVRLGIGLYGVSPLPAPNPNLNVVASLKSTIISLKKWPAGTTIGYSRKGVLTRDSVIATVPIGYADGLDRHLSCGIGKFYINGHMCPTVGNICMDQCMVDVTEVPNPEIGMEVEIYGHHIPVEHVADQLGTIPYELLTSVSPRVRRMYFRD